MAAQTGKVVLVTGASSGIGAALARESARRGNHLVLTARRAERLEELAREARAHGVDALVVAADLRDPGASAQIVAAAVERFGGLDILVNNAGIGVPQIFAAADPEAIRHQLQVNFIAPIMLTRHALPHLIERRGMVINVGSAITSVANSALGAYGATKAGLAYWNDALRRELAHRGVRVCLVEPGPVATEFFESMGVVGPQGQGIYNPMRDPPPPALQIDPHDAARRIARLFTSPRRRISVGRRVVWPHRVAGAIFQLAPWLGDLALGEMVRHLERTIDAPNLPVDPPRSP
jgi:uncharacterized protein